MKKIIWVQTLFFCFVAIISTAQTKTNKNAIGISIPVIWNSSYAKYGSSKKASGDAISYGANFNYSRTIVNKVYGIIGIGYFKQAFGIIRYFDLYDTLIGGPATYTNLYSYHTIHLRLGLGYYHEVRENLSINGSVDFNEYYSFTQKYGGLASHKSMSLGETLNLKLGIDKKLAGNFSFGAGAVFPFHVNWKTDPAFQEYPQIARNKLSLGIELSGKYNF